MSLVDLALIPEEDVVLGYEKLNESTAKMHNEKIEEFVSYFELRGWDRKVCEGDELGPLSCLNFGAKSKMPKKYAPKTITQWSGDTVQ